MLFEVRTVAAPAGGVIGRGTKGLRGAGNALLLDLRIGHRR